MTRENPCLSCGACCAFFRVSFYWGETTDSTEGTVPAHLTEDVAPFFRAMKGSNQKNPRCIALEGEVGNFVRCSIYEKRSSSCCEFGIKFVNGQVFASMEDYERCTHARAQWGLAPIQVDVFRSAESISVQPSPWPVTMRRKSRKHSGTPQQTPDQNPVFPPPV